MNRQELEDLLAQTHHACRPGMASSGLCNPSSTLSPRQKFQAHVRTLSTDSLSTSGSQTAPQRSPDLQHVSSLRVQPRESESPQYASRPSPIYRVSDPSLSPGRNAQYEPPFIREEREAWSRASPSRMLRGRAQDVYILQPKRDESPIMQPSKHLRGLKPFAPLPESPEVDERPKTSRGHNHNLTETVDHRPRNSRFAEGSMNDRSAGVSSAWLEHGSASSISGTESDHDSTPRASPQRSSIDIDEFRPAAVTPATLRQRLSKIGTVFKSHEHSRTPAEGEAHPEKKKGLRKSISLWNMHGFGGRTKTFGGSAHDLTPKAPVQGKTLEVLNDRKRRAEEAYVHQFGVKKRKSNIGQETPPYEQALEKTPSATDGRSLARRESKTPTRNRRIRRSSSVEATRDFDVLGSHSDIDHHKRPSRRELEKENQQLRAMLRQQHQEPILESNMSEAKATLTDTQPLPVPGYESDVTTTKSSGKNHTQKPRARDLPPVPQIPERVVLKTLSNTRNQPQAKAKNSSSNSNPRANMNSTHNVNIVTNSVKEVNPVDAVTVGLPRPVSVIFEVDEEEGDNKNSTFQCVKRLEPSDIEKIKMQEQMALQIKGVKREQWEWPEDVF